MRSIVSNAILVLALLGSLVGCKTNTAGYPNDNNQNPEKNYLEINQNRQFENGFTSNNPLDKTGLQ